ncbi:hypothetical protein Clacol_006368 [Clathrus columnatus]|uniref:Uncharacterized protein n=1 Tax=Clathrus columnatus TaxID=1419009 RepID=A0AAV5AEH6_9AGAM|nr:hypothetical protein Clacol_006368 [Clathrus columnatus]
MDFAPFASLCHIRILIVPVGNIKQTSYEKWSKTIQTFQTIRLEDITPNKRDEYARFMPSPLSNGFLHLEYVSHPPPIWQAPLTLFRPSEFPLGIIGIADDSSNLTEIQSQFNAEIAQLFSANSFFPLSQNCYVFEDEEPTKRISPTTESEIPPGLIVIPKIMGHKNVYVGTLIAELCSGILTEFANIAKVVESSGGMEMINFGFFPIVTGMSENRVDIFEKGRGNVAGRPISTRNLATSAFNLPATSIASKRQSGTTVPPTGRLFKFLGDLFLLAGRSSDAGVWYEKSISLLSKTPEDSIWHASAMEGLCVVQFLDNWGASAEPDQKEIWREMADKLSHASNLYSRVSPGPVTASSQLDATLITYLYTSCVCRHTVLLFSVWGTKGWGIGTFNTLLYPGLPPSLTQLDADEYQRHRLTATTAINCAQISLVLAQAHGPFLLHLEPYDRIRLLRFMATVYSAIGFQRKEVYILRELLSSIMDTLVSSREEILKGSKSPREETNGSLNLKESGNLAFRTLESPQGNESITRLGKYICEVYGIDLTSVKLLGNDQTIQTKLDTPFESPPSQYGWDDLQLGAVREAVAIAEALPDYAAVAQFDLSALRILGDILSSQDQNYLYSSSARAFLTARRRGDDRRVEYWARNPVVKIEINPLPFVRLPLEYQARHLAPPAENGSTATGERDPFIYNPRLTLSKSKRQTLVVQNEPIELLITLRNPYAFDFELPSLSLSTTGVPFNMEPISISLPANSIQTKQIVITPLESGLLVLKGCTVQAPNGVPHEFLLPISTPEAETAQEIYRSKWNAEAIRVKETGLNARPWLRQQRLFTLTKSRAKTTSTPSFLECMVAPEQPLIRIRRTSLTHGAVMMYDGESSTIRLTIENVSTVPVQFLKVVCSDSTMIQARQALDDGELSVFETYETEYELLRRPVLKWDMSTEPKSIAPGKTTVLTITCTGKLNCTSGSLQILYSSTAIDKLSPSEMCYTRQIVYPVVVTVYSSLECSNMEIIPFNTMIKPWNSKSTQGVPFEHDALRLEEEANDWCLFMIDIRNTYGTPFEVTFERNQDGTSSDVVTQLVSPGATSKVLIPLRRFSLPGSTVNMAIPTLLDRQFIVSKTNLTAEEERHQRELFWYREELFRRVKGRWKEIGGNRFGSLSLRHQRFTAHMLNVIRTDQATVKLSLVMDEKDSPSSKGITTARANEFVYLRAKLKNQSSDPLIMTMQVSISPGEYVLFDGIMSNIPVGKMKAGEERQLDFGVCFVSEGLFDIRAEITILLEGGRSKDVRTEEGHLRVFIGE